MVSWYVGELSVLPYIVGKLFSYLLATFILFLWILMLNKVRADASIMQTIKLIWVNSNCFRNGYLK